VQVLGNLLGNAAKFTPRGGKVNVLVRRDGQMVAVSVRDTGVGISPEVRQRLFVPFSQAPQALDRTRGGLGLGLAMVKGLVELHRGTVEVASEGPGLGAEFTVRLPLAAAPTKAPPVEKHPDRRFRVLVVEDNVDAADSLREALELDGHQAQVAYDGPAALAIARALRPDIVICDIGLPGMDGYEVARAFRADEVLKSSYLIALSGYARPEDLQRATEAGFDRHVAKPSSLEKLEHVLAEATVSATGADLLH
jgi:two-component system CheB/CheR fusion protein